jgi:type IV pilus assembly protein PilV
MSSQLSVIRARKRQLGGFAMLESMVAMLLFTVGVLGVVGLQATMTRAQSVAKYRGDAIYLASQLVGVIRADTATSAAGISNIGNLANYASAGGKCANYARCADWSGKVARALPGGATVLAVDLANSLVTITITWTPPNEGTHSFSTTTQIS